GLYPAYTLEHLFTGEKSIQDIVLEGPEGIQVIPGASGFAQCVELDVGQQQRLVTSIRAIEPHYDYMMVDTAAGISPTVLHFIAASQVAVVVVTPEPTSLTDAFSLLKVLKRRGYRRKVQIVVNMVSNAAQAKKVFQRFSQAVS
ncbi:AAA family ATPase, partial [Oleiphilus sp. HI0132]